MKAAAFLTVVLLTVPYIQAGAQSNPERSLGLVAASGFARDASVGYHAMLGVEFILPFKNARLRAEGLVADMGGDHKTAAAGLTASLSLLPRTGAPYFLATVAVSDSVGPQRGWGLGLGWRFHLADRVAFVESRVLSFHDPALRGPTDVDWRYLWVPMSFGLRF